MAVLEAKDLVKIYGRRAVVDRVSVSVTTGEIVGILGRNGAGKTTTFSIIAGQLKPDAGSVVLDGVDLTDLPSHRRALMGISYLPQERSTFRKLTVEQNLLIVLEERGLSRADRGKRVDELLDELGMRHLRKARAYTLSGGESRKLEVLRAMVLEPKFLMLDEPFAGIEPITIAEIQQIAVHLRAKGIGVIISDHNVHDLFEVCDRAYIVAEGKILIVGKPLDVASNPLARTAFLGEEFQLPEKIIRELRGKGA
ncbi:MAG: LPS export ABC transporter ATP-binding protein [Acidobacteriota bacterium]